MAYAIRRESGWDEIFGGFKAALLVNDELDEVSFPGNWPELATPEEREVLGIFEIEEPDPAASWVRVIGSVIEGDDTPRRIWLTEPVDPDQFKAQLIAQVNAEAGAFRRRFITDIPGQQATYLAKEQEAQAWTDSADPAGFPYLANEATETGRPISTVAGEVLATAALWRGLDPRIEGKRRGAAVAIGAAIEAGDPAAAAAAAQVDWPALLAG